MGRSLLSIKLAAVFGLLVAGAVTAQQKLTGAEQRESVEVQVVEELREEEECAAHVRTLVHTPRSTARGAAAGGAARI